MKKITSIFLVLAMVLTLAPMNIMAADSVFSDVKDTDYYAQAATALEELDILSGYPDGTFGAEKSITRAEMAAVVCRLIEKETDAENAKGETKFDDVNDEHWASGYINIASKEGIINGDGNGKFRPEDKVKYEEAVKMVVCALGYGDEVVVYPTEWSLGYIKVAEEKGILDNVKGLKGMSSTRGDVAVMSYNAITGDIPAPTASLKEGSYIGAKKVKLTAADGAEIYYTTDGSMPNAKSKKYEKEILIEKSCTLKAVATKDGILFSDVLNAKYGIKSTRGGEDDKAAVKKIVSRGEWIEKLVNAYGYPRVTDEIELSYTDIEESKYKNEIETAVVYGVLRDEEDIFESEKAATREFVAETAVYCLGYEPNVEVSCNDVSEISNPAAVKQAIDLGIFSLKNNCFYPNDKIDEKEAERVIGVIENTFNSANLGGNGEGFTFLEGVTVLTDTEVWVDEGNNEMIIPINEELPEVGDIVVFGTEKAIKVEEVYQTESGDTKIKYSLPELYEFLDSIDMAGEAMMDFSQFKPAEGVTVRNNSESPIQLMGFGDDFFDVPNTDVNVNANVTLDGAIDLGNNWEIGYELNFEVPSVAYKFDVDFDYNIFNDDPLVNVKNAYIKLKNETNLHVDFGRGIDTGDESFEDSMFDDVLEKEFQLGTVPLIGIDGLCVEVELDLVLKASGKFEIDYTVLGTVGCQILNNQLRNLSSLTSSYSYGLSAEAGAGAKIGLEAEVFGKDLLDFAIEAGAKAEGAVKIRSTGMVCMDATAYAYAELSALEYCLIDDWLDIGVTFEIWDSDNSPLKIRGHWENLNKVNECTFNEMGTINGTVANADNRLQYISGAKIDILNHATLNVEKTTNSDSTGKYSVKIPADSYVVKISADGYIPFESFETIEPNEEVYLETYLLVEGDEDSNETGTIGGIIKNTVTGSGISNAKLTIRKGWNKISGESVNTIYTTYNGGYNVTLPLGNYTICMECEGYMNNHFNVAVTKLGNLNAHGTMSPDNDNEIGTGEVRIVLTWGATPSDLDSHLVGPTVDGMGKFHTFFGNKSYFNNGQKYVDLDLDDTSSYGPETTTIYIQNNTGKYRYYVHDYSNAGQGNSKSMSNSGAKVQVYSQDQLMSTYYVPTNVVGTLWSVFEYDSETRRITPLNIMSNHSSAGSVGIQLFGIDNEDDMVDENIDIILESVSEKIK